MPLGDGFGQLLRPAGVTPLTSGVQTQTDPMAQVLAGLGSELERRVKPLAIEEARAQGESDGNAGTVQDRAMITDMDRAYVSAARQAYVASTNIDRDEALDGLFALNQANPAGFAAASQEAKSKAIADASPEFAVAIEQGWDRGIQRRASRLAIVARDLESKNQLDDINARVKTLQDSMEAAARNGTLGTAESLEMITEFNAQIDAKVANPIWSYTANEAQRDRVTMTGRLAALSVGREVMTTYEADIAAGKFSFVAAAEAKARLAKTFAENPALGSLGEAERVRFYGVADNALNETLTVRVAQDRAIEEAKERDALALKTSQAAATASIAGTLINSPNAYSDGELEAMATRGEISQTQSNTLRRQRRAEGDRVEREARQERADNERAAAQVRATQRAAEAAERAAAAQGRAAAAAQRSAAAAEQQVANDRFNRGSRARSDDLLDLAGKDPDRAYSMWSRSRQLMREGDDGQVRSAIRQSYGEIDSRIASALSDSGATPEAGRDAARRYDAWAQQNPYATREQRRLQGRAIGAGPTSTGLRAARSSSSGNRGYVAPLPAPRTAAPTRGRVQ